MLILELPLFQNFVSTNKSCTSFFNCIVRLWNVLPISKSLGTIFFGLILLLILILILPVLFTLFVLAPDVVHLLLNLIILIYFNFVFGSPVGLQPFPLSRTYVSFVYYFFCVGCTITCKFNIMQHHDRDSDVKFVIHCTVIQ